MGLMELVIGQLISYLVPFPSYGSLLVKFSLAAVDDLALTPWLGVIPCEFPDVLLPFHRMISDGENRMIVASFVLTQYQHVTERQTDGQTHS